MALETESIIIVLLSLLFGAIIGEAMKLEEIVNKMAYKIRRNLRNGSRLQKLSKDLYSFTHICRWSDGYSWSFR